MARMIPAAVDLEALPPGEQIVYRALATEPSTKNWVALHSFDLPRHIRQVQGEIDFVVIVPSLGVVCLEVKSHSSVQRRDDGMWVLGNDPPWAKGPFKQAAEATYSLLDEVRGRAPQLMAIPFVSAVCFPRCAFEVPAIEWEDWQVIDEPALARRPLGDLLAAALVHERGKFQLRGAAWLSKEAAPTPDETEALVRLLRPVFEVHQTPRSRAKELTLELHRYTEEQTTVLDVCELNERVFIQGAAGTGKTFLALEQARRFALTNGRTLLCCYNTQLRRWLESEAATEDSGLSVGTVHSIMLEAAGEPVPRDPTQEYWDHQLPEAALNSLIGGHSLGSAFDCIVVDEAQDILFPPFIDVLDLLLARGIRQGRLVMFADLERQAIFRHGSSEPAEVLASLFPGITRYPLHDNCRNTPRIGAMITQLVGGKELYRRFRRPDDGREADIFVWSSTAEQVQKLEQILDGFRAEGYRSEDIAVLSMVADSRAATGQLPPPWSDRIRPIENALPGHGRSSTIAAFKGLEAPAIVLTDISSLKNSWEESMLYVGMSRALDRLAILAGESARSDLLHIVLGEAT